jgi:hypothetical protein
LAILVAAWPTRIARALDTRIRKRKSWVLIPRLRIDRGRELSWGNLWIASRDTLTRRINLQPGFSVFPDSVLTIPRARCD